jgi:hypothetical protein
LFAAFNAIRFMWALRGVFGAFRALLGGQFAFGI